MAEGTGERRVSGDFLHYLFLAYLVYMGDYLPFNGRFASLFAGAIVGVFVGRGRR